jgi:hypothetical protein
MWRTRDGDRVLTDPEWAVFAAGLDVLWDGVEEDLAAGTAWPRTGVRAFDALTPEQQLALLADVAAALRDPAVPPPLPTAAAAAAVAAVYEHARALLETELLMSRGRRTASRRLVRAAVAAGPDRPRRLPPPTLRRRAAWFALLDRLIGRVLDDADFELADAVLDLPPDHARAVRSGLGIPADYFAAAPRHPGPAALAAARSTLCRLLDRPRPPDFGWRDDRGAV